MKIPDRYELIKESRYLLDRIGVKIDFMESKLHDIDPDELLKFVRMLTKAWRSKFFRED